MWTELTYDKNQEGNISFLYAVLLLDAEPCCCPPSLEQNKGCSWSLLLTGTQTWEIYTELFQSCCNYSKEQNCRESSWRGFFLLLRNSSFATESTSSVEELPFQPGLLKRRKKHPLVTTN